MNRVFRQRKELRVLTAPGNTALAAPQVNLSCSIGVPYFLFFFFLHTVFSHQKGQSMAAQLLDSVALRCHQAPGPLHLCSAVLCRQLASLKFPKQLGQVLPTAAELGQLLLVSFIPKKVFINFHLLIGQNCTPRPRIS